MSSAPMLGRMQVPVSADPAQLTVEVDQRPRRRAPDRETERLLRCIAAAYRSYHQADSTWTQTRYGEPRLRLVGNFGSELRPTRRYVSLDLEDFQ
jgi:hypothetical protein